MIFNKIKSYFSKEISLQDSQGWGAFVSVADSGELISSRSAYSLAPVWSCVNLLAGTIGSLPINIYRKNGDGQGEIISDHPLCFILQNSPNKDDTAMDFWEFIQASLELWGNGYALIDRIQNKIVSLTPINPEYVSVKRLNTGIIEYSWSEFGQSFKKTEKDILHIRGFGGDALGGLSTLSYARHTFGTARAAQKSAGSTFSNGLRPSGVLSFKEWLTSENRKIAEDNLVAKFAGSQNAGKPLILEGGVEWKSLNMNPDEAQLLESRSFSVEEICCLFGVPPNLIGHAQKNIAWGRGLNEQISGFQKFALHRRLKRNEQAMEKQLLTAEDRANGIYIRFDVEELLRGDPKQRAEFYKDLSSTGAITINEIRKKENLPPVPGGDVIRMQMQNVPITEIDELPSETLDDKN